MIVAEVLKPVKEVVRAVEETLPPVIKEVNREFLYQRTTYVYDKNNNLIQEQRHSGYWDKNGVLQEEDGKSLTIMFAYDKRNRRIRVEDGTGVVIRFQYDVQGKLLYEEKAISEEIRQVIHYRYDRAGHLIEQKEELQSGLPTKKGEAKLAITRQGNGCEAWEIQYDYDLKDRITHVKDCLGPIFTYAYDKNDWLKTEILPQAVEKAEYKKQNTYQYNLYGQVVEKADGRGIILESLTDVSGKTIHYNYDWQGRLSGIQDETGQLLVQYSHTLGGKLKKIHHNNGMSTLYEYDTEENIIHLRLENKSGETISDFHYDYDGNGNRILKTGGFTDGTGLRQSRIRYCYDKKNQLTEESYDEEAISYRYDLCGNRLEKTDRNGREV